MFVSNTSTLILLAKITLLQRFLDWDGAVVIPQDVLDEISRGKTFDVALIMKECELRRIVVLDVDSKKVKMAMEQFNLDRGEAAAFALFEQKYKGILTDDNELIKLCRIEQVPFICALAVVVRMHNAGKITIEEARMKLERLGTIGRYSPELLSKFRGDLDGNDITAR